MMDSPPTPAETSGIRFMPAATPGETPTPATMLSDRRVVAFEQVQGGRLDAEQLGGADRDGVQDLLQRRPPGDGPLDLGELLEQPFALVQRVDQAAVLLRVQAFRLDHVQGLQAEFQDPGHAAEQADVLGGETDADPAEDEQAAGVAADLGVGDGVRAGRQVEGEQPAGADLGELVGRHLRGGDAEGRGHRAVDHQHGDVRVEGQGGALHGGVLRGRPVGPVGYDGEELRHLLGCGCHVPSSRPERRAI